MKQFLKSENGKLYSSIVELNQPKTGLVVRLFPVIHIGRREYFELLYRRLNENDLVIYEGFGDRDREKRRSAYRFSAGGLGITAQDEAINYKRLPAKWLRADLKGEAAKQAVDELWPHEKLFLKNIGPLNAVAVGLLTAGFSNRRMLAEMLSAAQSLPLTLPLFGRLFDMILGRREAVVLRKVRSLVEGRPAGAKSIAIFYGAGHMQSLAEQLEKLGFVRGTTEWLPENAL